MSAFSKYISIKENFKLSRFWIIIISLVFLLVLSMFFYQLISSFPNKNLTDKKFGKISPVLEPVSLKEGEIVYYYPNYIISKDLTEMSCKKLYPLVEKSAYNPKQVASRLVNLSLKDIDSGYFFPYSSVLTGKVADVEVVEDNHAYVNFKDIAYIPSYSGHGSVVNQKSTNQLALDSGLEKKEVANERSEGQIFLPPCSVDLIADVFNATFAKNYGTKYVYFAINGNVPKFYEMTKLDCPGTENQCARVDKIKEDDFKFLSKKYVFFEKIVVDLPADWNFRKIDENLYAHTVQDPFFINIKISRKLSSEDVSSCPMKLNFECREITINNIKWIYSRIGSFGGYDYILETTYEGLTYIVSIQAKTGDPNSKYIVSLLELLFKSLSIN